MRARALAVVAAMLVLLPAVPLGAATYVCVTGDTCVYLRGNTLQVCVQGSCTTEPIPPDLPTLPPPPSVPPLPALPDVPPLSLPYIPHAPILIQGDAGFLLPTSGVINPYAAGTAQDPYVIQGWEITAVNVNTPVVYPIVQVPAIHILDTTKHVVIRDTLISGLDLPPMVKASLSLIGLWLDHADNVTLDHTTIESVDFAIYNDGADDFTLVNSTVQSTGSFPVQFLGGTDVSILNSTVANSTGHLASAGVWFEGGTNVLVKGSHSGVDPLGLYTF